MVWADGHLLDKGKYQIIGRPLGKGGFGITYKAVHTRLNKQVVIKTPNDDLIFDPEYPKFAHRFINEAQMLAKLGECPHPHIVSVSDLFEEENIHCLVMDFIDGESLWDLVRRKGALPELEAVKYICQIGDALNVLHQAGLVHRDATPMNIMLRNNGNAVLIDFGIAGEIIPHTVTSMRPMNEAFAPYEQRKGVRSPTVDIYTLTASLYYTVTGQRPTPCLDRKLDDVGLVPPKQHNSSISEKLNQAILQGMALEAEGRPQSIQNLLVLLQPDTDDLSSDKRVDYQNLRDLLKAGNWREADLETAKVMLKVAGREKEGYLNVEHIENFPCTDLRTIDRLWVKYSNGRFGFSVQKRIWESVGGKPGELSYEIYKKFGDRVGWYEMKKDNWKTYKDLTFSLNAPVGHLPVVFKTRLVRGVIEFIRFEMWGKGMALLSRRDL
ncbi:GUN4 domain-containing protein [Floridanema evergladense]|uniref:GUN4 domain-containing protein n=1 Tax=Floridaenema evergladense BLCC-F167 TaxID=3153639 RepID=A0ABV4WU84_9CYAN